MSSVSGACVARVALVCEPPDGGVAEHVRSLALALPAHGYEPVVLAPPDYVHADELTGDGREVRALPFRRDYGHPHLDARSLATITRAARDCALVHAHSAKAGVLGRVAGALAARPGVYTPHGFPFVGEMSAARRRFGVAVERALAPVTGTLVCVCEFERRVARERRLRPRRLAVVHNGCAPPDETVPVEPALAALRARGPVVGSLSTFRPAKALEVLVDAVPALLAAVPEATVALVGEGPEEPALRARAARLGLDRDRRLAFLPYRGPTARYLAALDVYVLCSAWEAFPIGVLEAQAWGVPQVVTAVGGTAEAVVEETGIVVPPRDPARLAAALVELLRDPVRRARMAAASRARHAELFTVERMVAQTATIYDRVLNPPRGVRARVAAARRRGSRPAHRA